LPSSSRLCHPERRTVVDARTGRRRRSGPDDAVRAVLPPSGDRGGRLAATGDDTRQREHDHTGEHPGPEREPGAEATRAAEVGGGPHEAPRGTGRQQLAERAEPRRQPRAGGRDARERVAEEHHRGGADREALGTDELLQPRQRQGERGDAERHRARDGPEGGLDAAEPEPQHGRDHGAAHEGDPARPATFHAVPRGNRARKATTGTIPPNTSGNASPPTPTPVGSPLGSGTTSTTSTVAVTAAAAACPAPVTLPEIAVEPALATRVVTRP